MNAPLVPLAGLYENTSERTGKRYFVGYLGKAKLVMLQNPEAKDGEPGWTLFLTERPEKNGATLASGGERSLARRRPTTPARPVGSGARHERPFDDPLGL